MNKKFQNHLKIQLSNLPSGGLYKSERVIVSRQANKIELAAGEKVLNFCANNYLGFAGHADFMSKYH